jgi:hypothetical protein
MFGYDINHRLALPNDRHRKKAAISTQERMPHISQYN